MTRQPPQNPTVDADLIKQLEQALVRRTHARRALAEALLMLDLAERDAPGRARELEARCAAHADALREAEAELQRIARA